MTPIDTKITLWQGILIGIAFLAYVYLSSYWVIEKTKKLIKDWKADTGQNPVNKKTYGKNNGRNNKSGV